MILTASLVELAAEVSRLESSSVVQSQSSYWTITTLTDWPMVSDATAQLVPLLLLVQLPPEALQLPEQQLQLELLLERLLELLLELPLELALQQVQAAAYLPDHLLEAQAVVVQLAEVMVALLTLTEVIAPSPWITSVSLPILSAATPSARLLARPLFFQITL